MKKKSKLLTSTALAALLLSSCGTKTYHGTYQFQMGKNNADHIGIYMDLTKDTVEVEQKEGTKVQMEKFALKLEAPIGGNTDSEEGSSSQSLIGGLLTYFKDGLTGGYKIEEKKEGEEENHLTLFPIIDIAELLKIIDKADEEEGGSSSSESSSSGESEFVIPSEFVDDIMIAKYNGSQIDVTVPVSLTDLMFQLYWYGFDIFGILEPEKELPKHEHGTHPTGEDVKEINKTFNTGLLPHLDLDVLVKYGVGASKVVEFRDFHQLTMTLKKAEL